VSGAWGRAGAPRLRAAGAIAALALSLAGCQVAQAPRPAGSAFPTAPPETVFRKAPCSLLDTDRVAQAVGNPLAKPQTATGLGAGHGCRWYPAAPGGWIVILDVTTPTTLAEQGRRDTTPARLFTAQRTPAAEAIPGLGDQGYWEPAVNRLAVLRGEALLQLLFVKPGAHFDRAQAVALARAALSNL
jgi:hypothetical protein